MLNLSLLNNEQHQAVIHKNGPLLILAGAGTGKTRVITHRIAHLVLDHQVPYNQILAVTFTNKAATEMTERVSQLLKKATKGLQISTFHSFGVRFLKKYITELGYERQFTIADDADRLAIIKQGLKKVSYDPKKFDPKIVLSKISLLKNMGHGPNSDFVFNDDYDIIINSLFQFYQNRLKINNLVDFDDLLVLPVKILSENSEIQMKESVKLKYIMVDEYQDTNFIQNKLLYYLADYHKNICVVGDDDQSIYSWRGADASNILEFDSFWKNCKVVKLEQNYRSTQTILNSANILIKNNKERKEKNLWSKLGQGSPLQFYLADSDRDEAEFIANQIKLLQMEKNARYKEFAILYRQNTQSRVIEEMLRLHSIPYKLIGGYKFYDRQEIKLLLHYLKLITNPKDEISLEKIINTPSRGLGQASYEKLSAHAHFLEIPVFEAIKVVDNIENLPIEKQEAFVRFYKMIKSYKTKFLDEKLSDTFRELLNEIQFSQALKKIAKNDEDFKVKKDNVHEFINSLKDYEMRFSEPSLEKYLDRIMLLSQETPDESDYNAVTLMTLHASKGLEYPFVFLIGMEEGVFPSRRSINESEDLSEERRLAYVGVTRAKQNLYLSAVKERTKYNEVIQSELSRFLFEIPSEYFEQAPRLEADNDLREERAKDAAKSFFAKLKEMRENQQE
jgi:superfamily I DNA/RNA helicase